MKLIKKQVAIYELLVKSFINFYELKCNLPGLITGEDIEVREDLYPESVSAIFATPYDYNIVMSIHFDSEFGGYIVSVDINFLDGQTEVIFTSDVYSSDQLNDHQFTTEVEQLSDKDFNNLVSKYLPIIESFLDTLDGIERNKPCEIECYYNEQRKKNNRGCDKMYISKSEYTPEKDAWKQRITLSREQMKINKYDF
ncbi:MAG TPA: hypothetical protein VIL99_04485 [Ignavibacteria bacterium]